MPTDVLTVIQDCAEWQLRPLLDPAMGSGAFHLDQHADAIPAEKLNLDGDAQTAIYGLLMDTFAAKK